MRFQSILKRALWGGLVSLSIVGSPTPGWAATTEKAMLTQIQEQLIGFRQDLKQSIAQKQEDQQKIYANLKNKVNELTTGMATGRAARSRAAGAALPREAAHGAGAPCDRSRR